MASYFICDTIVVNHCILRFEPPQYNWNIVESGVKHHNPSISFNILELPEK
jgi:hypothetical protein